MKHLLIALLLFTSLATLKSQQSAETTLKVEQIEPLPTGHIITNLGSGNVTIERLASNLTVTAPTGYTSTNQQGLNDEFAADIQALVAGGSDGNNFTTSIAFTGTTTKTLTLGRDGLANLTASFADNVNDADASVTNEIQTLSRNTTNNLASLSLSGGSAIVADIVSAQTFTGSTGSTLTLSTAPTLTYLASMQIRRNGVEQTFSNVGSATDVTVTGTTLTFNYRALTSDEVVVVKYISN